MARKKKKWNLKSRLISSIRRVWRFCPLKTEAKALAKINRGKNKGLYRCAKCRKAFEKVHVDHIDPVVSVEDGFQGYDIFIERLFPDICKLQVLCITCHNKKTKGERDERKRVKDKARKR